MRVSRAQAEENRATVVKVASRMFRERGFDGVGIADIMKAAGLTHGGFYGQFSSKEQLETEASGAAMSAAQRRWQEALAADPVAPLRAIADFYLTAPHRDHPESGCPFAALAPDAARSGPQVKAVFGKGIEGHLALMERSLMGQGAEPVEARRVSLAALSTLVGALALSRAVDDPALSDEILASAAESLGLKPDG